MLGVASNDLPSKVGGGGGKWNGGNGDDDPSVASEGDGYGRRTRLGYFKSAFHGSLADTVMDEWLLGDTAAPSNRESTLLIGPHAWYHGSSGGNGAWQKKGLQIVTPAIPHHAAPRLRYGGGGDLSATDAKAAALQVAQTRSPSSHSTSGAS